MKSLSVMGVILIGLIIFGHTEVWGGLVEDRASLQGMEGLYILIDGQFESLIRKGITKEQLKTDVELQLRKAGIKVLTEQESVALPGTPYLSVTFQVSEGICKVSHTDSSLKFYAIGMLIQLHQEVRLDRNPKIKINGVTWKAATTSWFTAKEMKNGTREHLKNGIDLFANEYLAVNSK